MDRVQLAAPLDCSRVRRPPVAQVARQCQQRRRCRACVAGPDSPPHDPVVRETPYHRVCVVEHCSSCLAARWFRYASQCYAGRAISRGIGICRSCCGTRIGDRSASCGRKRACFLRWPGGGGGVRRRFGGRLRRLDSESLASVYSGAAYVMVSPRGAVQPQRAPGKRVSLLKETLVCTDRHMNSAIEVRYGIARGTRHCNLKALRLLLPSGPVTPVLQPPVRLRLQSHGHRARTSCNSAPLTFTGYGTEHLAVGLPETVQLGLQQPRRTRI